MANSEQKNLRTEKVEMRTEKPEKIENVDELAGQYVKSLEGRMGGPVELRQEVPSKFEQPRREIALTANEMIGAIRAKKGISLKGAGPVKKNVLEALSSLKRRPKVAELDIWGQTGSRAERITM
ncbi:MAG: hypothetical protein A2Y82_03975 [Candidatus Buchananbacteria bacterium RBG_13_36_9]|uniref:Uncharacterized protein n=1 Tax=Candidatus Buchananbacteria bacterium RBG_13_36_9 TaxID=1797530 RepID=A0A1G1XR43_9BACT|nr:MAG: hypothetical protein A2Y82_03975 [Candidatus Buchananbacteria bacterium RBG_13_36_9]